jgi:hypothetical protein
LPPSAGGPYPGRDYQWSRPRCWRYVIPPL